MRWPFLALAGGGWGDDGGVRGADGGVRVWGLASLIQDAGARWAAASALGAAVAALAVLWGQGFAASAATPPPPPLAAVTASGTRAVAVQGSVKGNITTGDRGVPAAPPRPGRFPPRRATRCPRRRWCRDQ